MNNRNTTVITKKINDFPNGKFCSKARMDIALNLTYCRFIFE